MQIEKANPKMGFWRAKQGLSKTWDIKAKLVSNLGKSSKTDGRRIREEEEEEEEEKKRKRRSSKKVWNFEFCMKTTLCMDFVWITWNFKALYG